VLIIHKVETTLMFFY